VSEAKSRVRLCKADDVATGAMLQVSCPGLPALAVYRIADREFYCTQDLCTHGSASLSDEGDLEGYIVECSWHAGKFDIRSGQPCSLPCTEPLRTFPVSIADGEVFIEV
jgi:p-cumate 2,3-dioxygenase ferredoxin component